MPDGQGEGLYRLLFEQTTDYAILTLGVDGVIQSWNVGAERVFGWTAEEAIGQPADIIFTPEDRASGMQQREIALARDLGRADDERWHQRRDGSRFWATGVLFALTREDGARICLAKILRDDTERKVAIDNLFDSEERYRLLAEAIPQLVLTTEPDGTPRYANRRWRDTLRVPIDRWDEAVHPEDRQETVRCWQRSLRTGQGYERQMRLRMAPEDAWRWFMVHVVPMREGERMLGWLASATDIQARVEDEEALRQVQKLESIGVLAGGIAHDFNNLLTGILGNAALALRLLPAEGRDAAGRRLQDVILAAERAAQLTRQLLAYAGKGRLYVAQLDLCGLVTDMGDLLRVSLPPSVTITYDLQPSCPLLMADGAQMQQLVMNLVLNAAEAMEQTGGEVRVRARESWLGPEDLQCFPGFDLREGRHLRLEVEDQGVGMDEETQARIFDPFFTTKFTGRGLGLSAALGIVRGHRGAIAVRSAPGEGTCFTVLLPADDPDGQAEEPVSRREGTLQVLVVDDEPLVREAASAILKSEGFGVATAEHGRRALERLEAGEVYDVVLLDLTMPVLSGEETLPKLRALCPELPVVVTSGYGEKETLARFHGSKVEGFLQKPFDDQRLLDVIREAAGKR